jgi:hypothetical protein
MVLKLCLPTGKPTTVKLFALDGTLQHQVQLHNTINNIDLGMLKAGIYKLALSNAQLLHTRLLKIL